MHEFFFKFNFAFREYFFRTSPAPLPPISPSNGLSLTEANPMLPLVTKLIHERLVMIFGSATQVTESRYASR